ncbi:unnamed protein product [Clonostachys solani]|uniref:Major facilitator superfamily (MFS) profile domain-containing protein n=1 Tax=Clonostachys solani TaxID=160281 RepID=A0A9N9Z9I0_9HYPO|nr:unnamed protein product [Clonostachys solani]
MASPKQSCDVEMVENHTDPSLPHLSDAELAIEKRGLMLTLGCFHRLVSKVDRRLLPVTALIYLLCYLDRSNIGNARILNSDTGDDIMQSLNLSSEQYIIALMLFLVAYSIFEAPSNLALKVFSPKRWLGFLVFTFGAFCVSIGGAQNFATVTALRFFLGAAEAGVFPGMVYYLSFWYKAEERAFRIAVFLSSATLAGACIAYGVGYMNRAGGLQAWRWLFILEGAPATVLGICIFIFLPSYPEQCGWLSREEKAVQTKRLGELGSRLVFSDGCLHFVSCFLMSCSKQKITWVDAKATLRDCRLLVHYLSYLGMGCLIGSLSLFAPVIVLGMGFEGLRAQLFTVPPYGAAFICTIAASIFSDRLNSRGFIVGSALSICCISFLILAALPGEHFVARYVLLIIGNCGAFAGLPSVTAWVGDNMTSTTAISLSIAINIAFSGPGQIIGLWIYRPADRPLYTLGHGVNAGFAAFAALLCFGMSLYYRYLNKQGRLRPDGRPWVC